MGCFLGCFGGEKDHKRRKQRTKRASPQVQRNRVQNVHQENVSTAEQTIAETPPNNLVSELRNKRTEGEKLSPSPRKRVTFNSDITTYEHVLIKESINSLPEYNENVGRENQEDLRKTSPLHSLSEDDSSVISSVGSYPPNHRYHNTRDSDDEVEEYGDSDLDNFDDLDDEDDYDDYNEHIDYESVLTASVESRTENSAAQATNEEVESRPTLKIQPPDQEVKVCGSKANARDRSDYINSVLNPIENITQWKAAKSQGTHLLKPQEKLTTNFEAPHVSFSSGPTSRKSSLSFRSKSHQLKNENQEIAVDASLSNWLVSPEIMLKKTSSSGLDTLTSGTNMSQDSTSVKNFEDRPILGALTVAELRQISATSSPKKSPSRSPDEMPIIGTVGTYWNHSASATRSDSASSYKGIPNTTSKYREDKRVNWHSTPFETIFETRLDIALKLGAAEA